MTKKHHATDLQMIPVDQIAVLNPRDRNGRVFEEIVGNIKSIGLKKPVTVTPRDDLEDGKRFLLICGEGRLKAFRSLGEKEIPALVVAVNDEDSRDASRDVAAALRARGIPCEIAPSAARFGKQIRYADRRGIPFVFATGYDDRTALPPELLSVPVVRKPYDTEQLRKALGTYLDKAEATASEASGACFSL